MTKITSKIDTQSESFLKNSKRMLGLTEKLRHLQTKIREGGSDRAKKRQSSLGKLPVRDRITLLIDHDEAFLEFSSLAGHEMYDEEIPAGGIVTGLAKVSGQLAVIVANDATVKGGCYYPITVKKHLRAQEIALANRLPCIYLVDSGGAYLPMQSDVFPDRDHFGRIFHYQANLSKMGLMQIAVVMGSCTAGGAYVPAMADATIMVKEKSTVFLAGPPLVKAAIGETVSAELLGGADVHTRLSGVADYFAETEQQALDQARQLMEFSRPGIQTLRREISSLPKHDPKELYGLVPTDPRHLIDPREVIIRIVDDSEFDEFKPRYGTTLVCGFVKIDGYPVGIVTNHGVLLSDSSLKGAHFIQLCCQQKIPLLFLQNITGFMVGSQQEHLGIAKHGAKLVNTVATANVPKLTVIIGNSFGAGNYGMAGRAFDPRFVWSWPNARVGVMGSEQAASVLSTVKRMQAEREGNRFDSAVEVELVNQIKERYEKETHAYYGSARLWDDGVIDPVETRQVISLGLQACAQSPIDSAGFGLFRM